MSRVACSTRNGSHSERSSPAPKGSASPPSLDDAGSQPCDPACEAAWGVVCRGAASRPIFVPNMAPHLRFLLASWNFACISARSRFGLAETVDRPGSVRGVRRINGDSGGVMTKAWGEGWVRRGGPHILLPLVAMLVSGCFHVGPSAKQAMTSAAPGARTAAGCARHAAQAEAPFDLENPAVQSRVDRVPDAPPRASSAARSSRGAKYLPSMTDILVREGLPAELAYLPLIESGYRPQAVSPAGAAGPWQFIPETGRRYGLRIDALVDERRDPIKSTARRLAVSEGSARDVRRLGAVARRLQQRRVPRRPHPRQQEGRRRLSGTCASAAISRARPPPTCRSSSPRCRSRARPRTTASRPRPTRPSTTRWSTSTVRCRCAPPPTSAASSATELAELNPALRSGVTPSGYSLRVPAGKAEPLRIGLATYVEPVHARRNVARSTRGGRSGRSIARGGRGVVAVAQGKKSSERVARTAPQRYRRGDRPTVQTARARIGADCARPSSAPPSAA